MENFADINSVIVSYNLYKDGAFLANVAVGTQTYTDAGTLPGTYAYWLEPVYEGNYPTYAKSYAAGTVGFVASLHR